MNLANSFFRNNQTPIACHYVRHVDDAELVEHLVPRVSSAQPNLILRHRLATLCVVRRIAYDASKTLLPSASITDKILPILSVEAKIFRNKARMDSFVPSSLSINYQGTISVTPSILYSVPSFFSFTSSVGWNVFIVPVGPAISVSKETR